MNYFICGFTGAGKTTFLNDLQLEKPLVHFSFIDLDEYILKKNNKFKNLGDLIRKEGFEFFRNQELAAFRELSTKDSIFLSLGGGTLDILPLKETEKWKGMWLNTEFETCYNRIKGDENRPLLKNSKEKLHEIYVNRIKSYSQFQPINSVAQVLEITKSE